MARFRVAPFTIDGEPLPVAWRDSADLSEKWLKACADFLAAHGDSFNAAWQRPLDHVRTRMTSAAGVATVTFHVNGVIECSMLLARGEDAASEREVAGMFVESLRGADVVRQHAASDRPFQGMLEIQERPLVALVPWGSTANSQEDQRFAIELALHFAAAYLTRG